MAREPFQREGRADAAGPGRRDRPRVRLGRARAAGARGPDRRRRRRADVAERVGRPARLPRALDDERLLPPARGHRRDHAPRRLARQRGPRLPRRRRDPRLRPPEGPHHQGRPQPRAAGDRGGRGRASRGSGAGCVVAFGVPNAGARHRGAGGRGRDPRRRRRRAGAARRARSPSAWPRRWTCRPTRSSSCRRARCRRPRAARCAARRRGSSTSQGALGRPPRTTLAQKARLAAAALAEAVRPGVERARGAPSTRRGSPSPCRCCSSPPWLLVALVPSRRFAFALSRFAARAGLRLARLPPRGRGPRAAPPPRARWCWPRTTPPTPTWPRSLALLPADFLFVAKREVLGYPLIGAFVATLRPPHRGPLGRPAERRRRGPRGAGAARRRGRALLPGGHLRGRHRPAPLPPGRVPGGGHRRARPSSPSPCAARAA